MFLITVFIFYIQFMFVFMQHGEGAANVWSQGCQNRERILNECNWCTCSNNKFSCTSRDCSSVDMAGHFVDAFKEIAVGMEGHGSWRSEETACQPGVQYQREHLVCVCDEEGRWPNPLCRDLFRILHDVDETYKGLQIRDQKCYTGKYYLFDCNVCICPPSERIDSQFCTKKNCTLDDPVLDETIPYIENEVDDTTDVDIYADCELHRKYKFGCRKCTCQRNNRLVCDKCTTLCSDVGPNEVFNQNCNTCTCDKKGNMLCTAKNCLKESEKPQVEFSKPTELILRSVDSPVDDFECVPGTKYNKDCNTCYCTENKDGIKSFSCTLQNCDSNSNIDVAKDCVENTVYESNCLKCRCDVVDGVKRESCVINSVCKNNETRSTELSSLHGYCEPAHVYQKDCNECLCLSSGKAVLCTSKICKKKKEPIVIDIIPISQKGGAVCPKNHMYKVDCNLCFCLSNGNVLCTTAECKKPPSK